MLPDAAVAHYQRQQLLTAAALVAGRRVWRRMGPDFDTSWVTVGAALAAALVASKRSAAADAAAYVPQVVAEVGLDPSSEGRVNPTAFAETAASGLALMTVLYQPVIVAKQQVGSGGTVDEALAAGLQRLELIMATEVADSARLATSAGIAARPKVTGYVRMLNPPSCSRCAVLAGKFYRWNAGFQRHPRCDCRHIPASEALASDLVTDPRAYFDSLSPVEQARVFTKDGARAIRDGADISQVVNARRGMRTAQVNGKDRGITTEGTTRRGLYGKQRPGRVRLMPEEIYRIAKDREDAIRLLKRYGYLF